MSTHTKKEFSELCGMATRHLSVYIKRNKVVLLDSGLIDDTNPINKTFIGLHDGGKKKASTKKETIEKPPRNDLYELEKQQKTMAIEAKRKEMTLTDARIARMHGELMPTDVVNTLFAHHFREVNSQFKQGIDGILSEFGKKLHANGNQMSEMRGRMVQILNECVKKSVANSKKHIETVLKELSEVKKVA